MGLSTAFLLNVSGLVSIPSFIIEGILTPIIPGLLGCIYLGNLALKSYVFHQLKKDEKKAKNEYEAYLGTIKGKLAISPDAENERLFEAYRKSNEKRIKAEKKVAFATFELFTSMIVVLGVTLSVLAVGIAFPPAILIYVGVGLAVASKAFEFFDNHAGPVKAFQDFLLKRCGLKTTPVTPGRYTKPLRNFFRRIFKLKSDEAENQMQGAVVSSPSPVEDPKPVPVEDLKPVPVEDLKPVPVEDPKPVPVEDPKPVPVEDPKPVPVEDPKPVPVEDLKPVPVEDLKLSTTAQLLPQLVDLDSSVGSVREQQNEIKHSAPLFNNNSVRDDEEPKLNTHLVLGHSIL
jgi:hypothetical protein